MHLLRATACLYCHCIDVVSCIVAKCPDLAGTVPIFGPMSRFISFCSIVPESSSIAQMEVWHKHRLSILSNFSPYISMFSECGNTESPENGCGHPKVGVANEISRGCPGLSSHKLGNYARAQPLLSKKGERVW